MSPNHAQPHDLHAERALIGTVLCDPDALVVALDTMGPDGREFYSPHHTAIWPAVVAVARSGAQVNEAAVDAELTTRKASMDARDALMACTHEWVGSGGAIEARCKRVCDLAAMRAAITWMQHATVEAMAGVEDTTAWLDGLESGFADVVAGRTGAGEMHDAADVVVECVEALTERAERAGEGGGPEGHETGLTKLDDALSGLCPGKLYVVGGRPGMGKSMLGKEFVAGLAKRGKRGVVFSLEMSRREWFDRVVCAEADILYSNYRDARMDKGEWARMANAAEVVGQWPVHICDKAGVSVDFVTRWSRRVANRKGELGVILVDYLQLMRSSAKSRDSREQEVADQSRRLKELAKDLNVPVVALSQLNRGVENRTDKRPMISDLRESGSIEQDADAIMLCYRDEYYDSDSPDAGIVEVDIGKQRAGETGVLKLSWQGSRARIANLESFRPDPEDAR